MHRPGRRQSWDRSLLRRVKKKEKYRRRLTDLVLNLSTRGEAQPNGTSPISPTNPSARVGPDDCLPKQNWLFGSILRLARQGLRGRVITEPELFQPLPEGIISGFDCNTAVGAYQGFNPEAPKPCLAVRISSTGLTSVDRKLTK